MLASSFGQLAANGCCMIDVDEQFGEVNDAAEVLKAWFSTSSQQKKNVTASSAQNVAAGAGRGYFALPAKEAIEVNQFWKPEGVSADLRLAARMAYSSLQHTANTVVNSILTTHGFKLKAQQVQDLLQPGNSKPHSSGSNSSLLHINNYRTAKVTTAAAAGHPGGFSLQGCEAHVDKGLLTVIYSTGPGLQVMSRDGCWAPVTPGPGQLVLLVGHTLSFMTAGRLPAALHRVVTQQPASAAGSSRGSSRLSLCFKLHATVDALLSPAKVTGTDAALLPERYRCPKTTQQLMAEFDATHVSIHSQPAHQQQPEGMPAATNAEAGTMPAAAAAAATTLGSPGSARAGAASSAAKRRDSTDPDQNRKRPRLQQHATALAEDINQEKRPGMLTISILHEQTGVRTHYKIKVTTALGRVMGAYETLQGVGRSSLRFVFDGKRLVSTGHQKIVK